MIMNLICFLIKIIIVVDLLDRFCFDSNKIRKTKHYFFLLLFFDIHECLRAKKETYEVLYKYINTYEH